MHPWRQRIPCGTLSLAGTGQEVFLAGWVDALRDHGEVLFIHLRDRSGIVQVVFSPEHAPAETCRLAATLRNEYCIAVTGRVAGRTAGTENPALETGRVEVMARDLAVLNPSAPLPYPLSEKAMVAGAGPRGAETVSEDLRLQYRYLDLRRPSMQRHLGLRHQINLRLRQFLTEEGFVEVETPILTKSTPEGARDYLVPSRIFPQRFYALPQSPQLFKQLLMIGGLERYFQLARCFRDEDLRPNRQPEFTQLDIEASFIDEEFLYRLMEELACRLFAIGGIALPRPFPRLTWKEAMDTTGTDRPDLRFGLRFVDATEVFRDTGYGIFRQILDRGGCIKGINAKGLSNKLSKNVLQNEYAKEIVPSFGAKGMTWMRIAGGRLESNIVQFFSPQEQEALRARFGAEEGDVLLLVADPSWEIVVSALGQLRLHLAGRLGLVPDQAFCPLWVTHFPLFTETEGRLSANHHPFTAPDRTDFDPANRQELLSLSSRAYDLVVNGEELGGGSIRIHDRSLQQKVFQALGFSPEDAREKFGFFLRALEYGTPPHGGIALGMDRVVAMILGAPSIREVIAFPKNRSAFCPLTEAPSPVAREQLADLGLLDLGDGRVLPGADAGQDLLSHLSWVSRIGLDEAERPFLQTAVDEARRLAALVMAQPEEAPPTYTVLPATNRTRNEAAALVSPLSEQGELFRSAPVRKGAFFKVASILE